MLISREGLVVLLNAMYYGGARTIEVSYPPVDMVFSINLMDKKLNTIGRSEYDKKVTFFKKTVCNGVDPFYLSEVPKSSCIMDCLFISGVLEPRYIPDIEKDLSRQADRDMMKGERPLFIGFDTNALRRRVNTHIRRIVNERGLKARFCLSTLVFDELFRQYDKKLPYEWEPPEQLCFMENFSNQLQRDARMARLGAVEYRKLKELKYTYEVKGDETKDNPDLKIVRSYDTLKAENDILLISGDKNFRDLANAKNMRVIDVKEPHNVPVELPISWEGACDLIYIAAVVFGMVDVNGAKVEGVWRGKDESNWNYEQVNLKCDGELKNKLDKFMRISKSQHD
ncbi:MAG: hypothetical protein SCH70_02545 [Candidatus Methanoperedens sp.]|nr:hypothetical protein [Candidatus Methanoperedens sp.]